MASEYQLQGSVKGIRPALDYKGQVRTDCHAVELQTETGLAGQEVLGPITASINHIGREVTITGPLSVNYSEKARKSFIRMEPGVLKPISNTGNAK